MSPRYLLLADDHLREKPELVAQFASRTGLDPAFCNGRVAALVNATCPCIAVGEAGCILGWLFRRNGRARQLVELDSEETGLIAATCGQALLTGYWGGYVAAIAGPESVRVLRDPSGTFPCYYTRQYGLSIFASDADVLVAGGAAIDIDLEEIGRQLYRAFVPAPATALRPIRELLAGFGLDGSAAQQRQLPCWSPWNHLSREADETNAAERLASTVQHCVEAWASTRGRLLLSVSGGLDSSILAACLARAGADTVCLTMFSDDASGDERTFARALCDHLKLPLIERRYRLEDIDIAHPLAAHLPRPRDRTQALAYEHVHLEVAEDVGADAFMTGNGGDHVFGYSQSAAPIADRYLVEGLGRGTFAAILEVCRQTGCSVLDAVRQAWRLAHDSRSHHIRANALFLHPDFVAGLGEADIRHFWLDPPPGALPGKAAHIATVLRVQPNIEGDRGANLPLLTPLLSQPIVEACLHVPSWEWRAGGRDRSLARRAFAGELPTMILDRRVKGTPGRFAAKLLDHFRGPIRDRLRGGHLASHGIIDSFAIEKLLAGERPIPDLERVRILELVNAEAWIDHWAARCQPIAPAEAEINAGGDVGIPVSSGPKT